jgi:hypothetical protein
MHVVDAEVWCVGSFSQVHTEETQMATGRAERFERKNVIVDGSKVRRLRRTLRASSESAAIRIAVDRTLALEEAVAALERLRRRGTWGKRLAS